ncbi:MAG: 50S ribosomal protein L23, partial [Kiritimatiellae bacterium]|nr:50S ribosomal protein L23 [Kiritimatiellia bacterium]
MTNEEVIKRVVVTEKSKKLELQNRYVVEVARAARKHQI